MNVCLMSAYRDPQFPKDFMFKAARLIGARDPPPVLAPLSRLPRGDQARSTNSDAIQDEPVPSSLRSTSGAEAQSSLCWLGSPALAKSPSRDRYVMASSDDSWLASDATQAPESGNLPDAELETSTRQQSLWKRIQNLFCC